MSEIKKDDISQYRNSRDVWLINTVAYRGAHFAAFPPNLALKCILAGCPENGIVIDPFFGSGTTGMVAAENGRRYIGITVFFLSVTWTELLFNFIFASAATFFPDALPAIFVISVLS